MPSLDKYRRVWFALLRAAGVSPDDRHAVQEAHCGKVSLSAWTAADYERAIASLQRATGQHNDQRAHVKSDESDRSDGSDGAWATAEQCALIEEIADEIEWRIGRARGPLAYLKRSSLKGPEAELRREILQGLADGGLAGAALWAKLTRKEAADFVRALLKQKARTPAVVRA